MLASLSRVRVWLFFFYHAPHVKDGLHNWGVIAWLLWTTDSPHVLPFTVDRDTHECFCRLQSNVFDAASLFQTNLVSRGTLKCTTWGHFFCVASWRFRITWCSFSKINARVNRKLKLKLICLFSRGKLTARFVCHWTVKHGHALFISWR